VNVILLLDRQLKVDNQAYLLNVNSASKQKEVEEITENIVIVFSHFEKEFKADFKPSCETIVAFKTGEKPGLTSRTKFKYMDMIGK
jgi:hypothetical protein